MFVRGCEKFVPALAYLFCLALSASCLASFAYFLADLCSCKISLATVLLFILGLRGGRGRGTCVSELWLCEIEIIIARLQIRGIGMIGLHCFARMIHCHDLEFHNSAFFAINCLPIRAIRGVAICFPIERVPHSYMIWYPPTVGNSCNLSTRPGREVAWISHRWRIPDHVCPHCERGKWIIRFKL